MRWKPELVDEDPDFLSGWIIFLLVVVALVAVVGVTAWWTGSWILGVVIAGALLVLLALCM